MGALWREPGGRAPLLGTLGDRYKRLWRLVSLSIGAPLLGNMEGRSCLAAFEIKRYIKKDVKMPCKQVSLSIWALLGNMEEIYLTGRFERRG